MIRRFMILGLLSLVSPMAHAQSIDSYELRAYAVGAAAPVQTFTFPTANVTCNLEPTPSGSTVNPTTAEWNDPANVWRVCRFVQGSGPLFSVPVGSYEGTLTAINPAGPSAESTRSPFSRLDAAGAPSGLRFVR